MRRADSQQLLSGHRLHGALLTTVVLCLCPAAPGAAQSVSGQLLERATDAPVDAASVHLLDHQDRVVAQTVTAEDGAFDLAAPAPGLYRLRAQRIGYSVTTSNPLVLRESERLVVEFRLSAAAVQLAPITVESREGPDLRDPLLKVGGYYDRQAHYGRDGSGFGYFLEGEDLRPTAFSVVDLVRDIPGIHVRPLGGRRTVLTGRRGCRLHLYLNGVLWRGAIEEMPVPSSIVAIEVYTGFIVPAEYLGIGSSMYPCGAIAVWTGIKAQR